MKRRFLLIIKAKVFLALPPYTQLSYDQQSEEAIKLAKEKLPECHAVADQPGDQWKLRQRKEVALFVEVGSSAVPIYQWFGETDRPAPFPEGTLLYFKELA